MIGLSILGILFWIFIICPVVGFVWEKIVNKENWDIHSYSAYMGLGIAITLVAHR